jgi:hypothetical protein
MQTHPPAPEQQTDARPVDMTTITETIQRALRPGPLPPYEELVALEQALLLIITELWAAVDKAERREPEAPGHERRRASLTAIRYQTAVGLGNGLVSAHTQVCALARDCRWLLTLHTTETGR